MSSENLVLTTDSEGIQFYLTEEYGLNDLKRCQNRSIEMLREIVEVFERNNIDYILAHGSLLGLIRHGGFIPWDDDCDLFVFEWDYARAIELLRRELPDDMIVHNRRTDPIYWPKWTKIRDLYSDTYEAIWTIDRKFRYHGICVDILLVRVEEKYRYLNGNKVDEIEKRINKRRNNYSKRSRFGKIKGAPRFCYRELKDKVRLRKIKDITNKDEKICVGNKGTVIECSFEYKDVFPVQYMDFLGIKVAVPNNPDGVLSSMYGDYMEMPKLEDRKPHFDKVTFLEEKEV